MPQAMHRGGKPDTHSSLTAPSAKPAPDGVHSAPGAPGSPGGHGPQAVSFTFSADLATVTGATVTHTAPVASTDTTTASSTPHTHTLDISAANFKTTVGTNDKGASAVVAVTETRTLANAVSTSTYADQDGDGVFTETAEVRVLTSLPTTATPTGHGRGAPTHQFTFNADGTIATDTLVLANGWLKADTIESSEKYVKTTFKGEAVVVKTVADSNGYHFEVFRDDNGDGVWTEIAEGHTAGTWVDASTGTVQLVGLQTLLSAADAIVG